MVETKIAAQLLSGRIVHFQPLEDSNYAIGQKSKNKNSIDILQAGLSLERANIALAMILDNEPNTKAEDLYIIQI